jgi:hypothetical protein
MARLIGAVGVTNVQWALPQEKVAAQADQALRRKFLERPHHKSPMPSCSSVAAVRRNGSYHPKPTGGRTVKKPSHPC